MKLKMFALLVFCLNSCSSTFVRTVEHKELEENVYAKLGSNCIYKKNSYETQAFFFCRDKKEPKFNVYIGQTAKPETMPNEYVLSDIKRHYENYLKKNNLKGKYIFYYSNQNVNDINVFNLSIE